MADPNLSAMGKKMAAHKTAESYVANGWWPLCSASSQREPSATVFELGLNHNRGPSLLVTSIHDDYWAPAWVYGLAWLIAPKHKTQIIFEHAYTLDGLEEIQLFENAYRENVKSSQERLLTLTEYMLQVGDKALVLSGIRSMAIAAQIDLDRTRREVKVHEGKTGSKQ